MRLQTVSFEAVSRALGTYKLRDNNKIHFWKGIVGFEDGGKVVENTAGMVQRIFGLGYQSLRGVHSNVYVFAIVLLFRYSLDVLEISDGPGGELYVELAKDSMWRL